MPAKASLPEFSRAIGPDGPARRHPKIHPDRLPRTVGRHRNPPPDHGNRLLPGRPRRHDLSDRLHLPGLRRTWAAAIDSRRIDLSLIGKCTEKLLEKYDVVLLEGAGGLFVPLEGLYNTIDYVAERRLPVILVTSPRLGSINHTLLSLEACRNRNIEVAKVVYNLYPPTDAPITDGTPGLPENVPAGVSSSGPVAGGKRPGTNYRKEAFELRFVPRTNNTKGSGC